MNKRSQKGGIVAGLLFIGVIAFVIGYFYSFPNFKDKETSENIAGCYIKNPDHKKDILVNGIKYSQVRLLTPTIFIEVQSHLAPIGKVQDADGVERDAYIPWLDGFGGGVGDPEKPGTPRIFPVQQGNDMLFLDVTDTVEKVPIGNKIFDIYRKTDKPIPDFIIQYCTKFPGIGPYPIIVQDTYAQSFPPFEFNTNDLKVDVLPLRLSTGTVFFCQQNNYCLPPKNVKYKLVAWEPFTQRIGMSPGGESMYVTAGDIPITTAGKTKVYRFNFISNSPAKFIAIFNGKKQFDYLPEEFASGSAVPVEPVDLHKKAPGEEEKQHLEAFVPFAIPAWGWWVPECKPAVYLYPTKDTLVNIKVNIPNGFLTYTDPLYPTNGWNVLAKPNGDLQYLSNNLQSSKGVVNYPTGIFPYLYYEGKIQDKMITKPNTGFVKAYDQLSSFFDDVLPKLGLNQKEKEEFKTYWLKALPKSPYYYMGIIPQEQLDMNEPLTVTPQQDTMIRVRLLFQRLDHPEEIQEPVMQTPQRNGFTVVDWGAYVKQDKNHPFTCLQ